MTRKVALVGRPNVGKSTLFNRLLGYQHSIVEKTPGVTRDRVEGICGWRGKKFILIDTGGIVHGTRKSIEEKVLEQVDEAIRVADLILFVVDARLGVQHADQEVAERLRVRGKKKTILLVTNKVDERRMEAALPEWYELGFGDPFPVSALHGRAIGDLLDEILDKLGETPPAPSAPLLKFCVAGRPNVGKSSLVNAMLGESRVIVHEEPGTTRDVVDTTFTYNENTLVLADTAGLRKRSKATESLEFYSRTRTIRTIRRADVVLLVLEADEGVMVQDKKIAGEIHEAGKGLIILANKWDKLPSVGKKAYDHLASHVRSELPFINYAPILPTSAVTGKGVDKILPEVIRVFRSWKQKFDAGMLKRVLTEAQFIVPPPSVRGVKVQIKSIVALGDSPPTFLLRTRTAAEIPGSYMRFLEGKLREAFDLSGTPIRMKVQARTPARKAGSSR